MSFDIFSIFRGGNQSQNQPPVTNPNNPAPTNQPGQPLPGTQAGTGTAPNGVVPAQDPAPQVTPKPDESPLTAHEKIWQTDPTKKPTETDVSTLFSGFDPAKALEAASKVDFTKVVTPDTAAKIAAGGQEAVTAFMESLNKVAQNVYGNSAIATTKIVEQALSRAQSVYDQRLQTEVKRIASRDSLVTQNPLLNNPAVQPVVEALQQTLLVKNPNATPGEINAQITDYLSALSQTFGKKSVETSASKKPAEEDWSKFFN